MSDFALSGDDLEQMYQEVILEASKNPHGREHFAPDLASEHASQSGNATVQAVHSAATPAATTWATSCVPASKRAGGAMYCAS